MPIDFSKFKQKADETLVAQKDAIKEKGTASKDAELSEITPGDLDQKVAHARHEKVPKSDLSPKDSKTRVNSPIDVNTIDNKINETINDRILKLVKIGLKHELTIDNMLQYFREVEMAKLYELKRYFSDSSGYKIDQMLKFLYTSGELKKDKNNWYSLK